MLQLDAFLFRCYNQLHNTCGVTSVKNISYSDMARLNSTSLSYVWLFTVKKASLLPRLHVEYSFSVSIFVYKTCFTYAIQPHRIKQTNNNKNSSGNGNQQTREKKKEAGKVENTKKRKSKKEKEKKWKKEKRIITKKTETLPQYTCSV